MQKKVLTTFLILFFTVIIFNINSVFGVGIVSQCWVNDIDGDGKNDLLFRTYTGPHESTVRIYHNTKSNEQVEQGQWTYWYNGSHDAKWIYTTNKGADSPSEYTFRSIGFAFHTDRISSYETGTKYGYSYIDPTRNLKLESQIVSVKELIDKVNDEYTTPKTIIEDYFSTVFYKVMRVNGTFTSEDWKKGTRLSNLQAVGQTEYRYTIIDMLGDKKNVYIADNVVYNSDLVQLIAKAKEKNATSGCYVSNIVISLATNAKDKYELAKTPAEFFEQYGKQPNIWWGKETRGQDGTGKAFSSVINLYDNELVFPQLSKRTVLVRHINVGNNTTISKDIVSSGTRIESTNIELIADYNKESQKTIQGEPLSLNYTGYQEYYEGMLDMEQSITKYPLQKDKFNRGLKALGYNVGVSNTENGALINVQARINNGTYTAFTNDVSSVYVEEKFTDADSDFVVIDIYYTEYDKDVEVNHLYVDENGNVLGSDKQVIKPNDTAKVNGEYIHRINQDVYMKEVYRKQIGKNVEVRYSDAMATLIAKDNNYQYLGYEMFDETINVNRMKTDNVVYSSNKTIATIGTQKQVNFYYKYENTLAELEPQKDISGTIVVESTKTSETITCNDENDNNYHVTTVPSGLETKVGITGIPKYMLGAIATKKIAVDESIDINLKVTMGNQAKSIKYENIPYSIMYNVVTDMAIYKLTSTEIYDTDSGKEGTSGDNLFSWKEKTIYPANNNISVKLSGIKDNIEKDNVEDIRNYVAINVKDKYGNKSNFSTNSISLTTQYLSEEEFKKFDIDGDNKITDSDKQEVEDNLTELNNLVKEKEELQNQAQKNFDIADSENKRLKELYDDANTEINTRKQAYDKASNELNELNKELSNLNSELTELKNEQENKKTASEQAAKKLKQAEDKEKELYEKYQQSIKDRERLESLANCNDKVLSDMFSPEKQEEVEQCKKYKAEYANALKEEERLAKEHSDSQLEVNNAQTAANIAADEYTNASGNVTSKEQEIENLEISISSKDNEVKVLFRLYIKYNKVYQKRKKAYETYNEDVFKPLEGALTAVNKQLTDAITARDEDAKKAEYFDTNFNTNKLLYEEFSSINENDGTLTANTLGLELNINVKDMNVKIDGKALYENESTEFSKKLEDYISENIPKIGNANSIDIDNRLYENIGNKLDINGYLDNTEKISEDVLNGVRLLSGKAEYQAQVVIGNKSANDIVDTVYYTNKNSDGKTHIFKLQNTSISKTYKVNTAVGNNTAVKYKEVKPVNVYTPITVKADLTVKSSQIVNQTTGDLKGSVIQINTPFAVQISSNIKDSVYNNKWNDEKLVDTTQQFNGGYYIKFDFDVHKVAINGITYKNGNRIQAGTWIGIIPKNKDGIANVIAQAYGNANDNTLDIISESNGRYWVRAVSYNVTDTMLNRSKKYSVITDMISATSDLKDMVFNICNDTSYFAEEEYGVVILNRIYDFKVTDVKDISWKSVFRKSTENSTNTHTGNLYFTGTTKWNSSTEKANNIISRPVSEIGRNPLRILPVGPYKSTDRTYIKAPKLGYRFSYDMKVTGAYYDDQGSARGKEVNITTKFYYISKDGKTYMPESDGTKAGIYLFYKTSDGKYVRIDNNGGGYDLRFTPNDGYRYIVDTATSTLSNKSISLGNLRNLTLTKDMATVSNNGSYITYYGEYKLPNSTIVVEVDSNGSYDINSPLKDGYIGVVFDIKAKAGTINIDNVPTDVVLSYSQDTIENKDNTSQWDYEGFLGFTKTGQKVQDGMLSIKLEKGIWSISKDKENNEYTANDLYNQIKGTVMLYDLDLRAATDYE